MNKLWKKKRYLTLDDVADCLSSTFNDLVQRVDVERFFLDGHLTGSVIANNWHCFALSSNDVRITAQGEDPNFFSELKSTPCRAPDEIINGVYQIDPSELSSSRKYLIIYLKDGSRAACYEVAHSNYAGKNSHISGGAQKPSFQELMDKINNGLDSQQESQSKEEFIANYVSPKISSDSIVIQPGDLETFIFKTNDEKSEKPVGSRERRSMELIILALAREAKYDLSKPYKAAEILQQSAARFGIELPSSQDTIAKYLESAAKHGI